MLVLLNGQLVDARSAAVSPFDRGFLFGDGIYEGLRSVVVDGRRRIVGLERHVRRMRAGLAAAGINWDAGQLGALGDALLDANRLDDAFLYVQVTRGTPALDGSVPVRSRAPMKPLTPTVFAFATPVAPLEAFDRVPTKAATTHEDLRWKKATVKSISLLGNVLAALDAHAHGAEEAILIRDGLVTEGTYTNVVVAVEGRGGLELATPAASSAPFLLGVTREILLETGVLVERAVRAEELASAREVILLGTTTMVTSVTRLDGRAVGDGVPGTGATRLLAELVGAIRAGRDGLEQQ